MHTNTDLAPMTDPMSNRDYRRSVRDYIRNGPVPEFMASDPSLRDFWPADAD